MKTKHMDVPVDWIAAHSSPRFDMSFPLHHLYQLRRTADFRKYTLIKADLEEATRSQSRATASAASSDQFQRHKAFPLPRRLALAPSPTTSGEFGLLDYASGAISSFREIFNTLCLMRIDDNSKVSAILNSRSPAQAAA